MDGYVSVCLYWEYSLRVMVIYIVKVSSWCCVIVVFRVVDELVLLI